MKKKFLCTVAVLLFGGLCTLGAILLRLHMSREERVELENRD